MEPLNPKEETRYAHINALRGDRVGAEVLGIERIVSEDSVRWAFKRATLEEWDTWLRVQERCVYEPLLAEAYVLDIDNTVKPLYGHQEGAELGYNPQKPGRPSHNYHTYFIGSLRVVLGVDCGAVECRGDLGHHPVSSVCPMAARKAPPARHARRSGAPATACVTPHAGTTDHTLKNNSAARSAGELLFLGSLQPLSTPRHRHSLGNSTLHDPKIVKSKVESAKSG